MNEKIECLKMAIEYEKIYIECAKKWHHPEGIVNIAEKFYEFISREGENREE